VREVTTKSYKTRIRTGGSLVDFGSIINPSPKDYIMKSDFMPPKTQADHEKIKLIDEVIQFKKHFKHVPKYPLKV
jgi:hypothetical protein